jgi:uncharacterized membrane protein YhaH (DUF805 family)
MGELGGKGFMGNKEKASFKKIDKEQYDILFGVKKLKKYDIRKNALKKAWEIRNFEIDKFWQRSAYFWGFIALIFGGYVTVVTGKFSQTAKDMYLDFYLILLGLIFSVAWFLAICGSKRWQDNWEKHIDYLEDEVTGPLYKTLYYKENKYYSVSKMNKIPAGVVIATWVLLLIQYFYNKCNENEIISELFFKYHKEFVFLLLPLLCTIFCIWFMLTKGQTDGGKLNAEFKKGGPNAFYTKD